MPITMSTWKKNDDSLTQDSRSCDLLVWISFFEASMNFIVSLNPPFIFFYCFLENIMFGTFSYGVNWH
jgi:hypothetical protein